MAVRTPPSWLQGGSHTAENDRNAVAAHIAGSGVVDTTDLAVTAPGGTMTVSVAAGAAFIKGSRAFQGVYHGLADSPTSLTVAASDATNARYDRVVLEVQDAAYAGAVNALRLFVVQGTAAASPVEPAIPADSLELARILVPAATTSVTSANVLDRRVRVSRRSSRFVPTGAGDTAVTVQGVAGQTANPFEVRDVTGQLNAAFRPDGLLTFPSSGSTDATTGGSGAVLPAAPQGFLHFWDTNNARLMKVPYYLP